MHLSCVIKSPWLGGSQGLLNAQECVTRLQATGSLWDQAGESRGLQFQAVSSCGENGPSLVLRPGCAPPKSPSFGDPWARPSAQVSELGEESDYLQLPEAGLGEVVG